MPIFVYTCSSACGQSVELITKTASAPVPQQIMKKCPRCMSQSAFVRTITAAAIRTPTTTAVARRNDYRRAKPNAKENILAGKTADGRPVAIAKSEQREVATRGLKNDPGRGHWRPRKKEAVKPYLVEESDRHWGEAVTSQFGEVEAPIQSEAVKEFSETYKTLAK